MGASDRATWLRDLARANAEQESGLADVYDANWGEIEDTHRSFIERFLAMLPPDGRVLDAACGTGKYVSMLLASGRTPVCVDHAPAYLEKVVEKAPGVTTARHHLQDLPFEAEFDGAMCVDAMEFVPPEDWPVVLGRFRSALRPGGWLYLTVELVPEAEVRAGHRAAVRLGLPVVDEGEAIWDEPDWYYHFYPALDRVRGWLADAGFAVQEELEGPWVDGAYAYHHVLPARVSRSHGRVDPGVPPSMRSTPLTLPFRVPLDGRGLLRFLGDRAIPGVEDVRDSTYARSLSTAQGPAVVSVTVDGDRVELASEPGEERLMRPLVEIARSLFDLDADPEAVRETLERDRALQPLLEAHPGVRVPGAADGFELAVRAIVGQQISVAAARTMLGRIAAHFGSSMDGSIELRFPSAEELAQAPLEELGIIGRRAGAIRRVAAMVAGGELDLSGASDTDETVGRLLEVDGIGPWTAEYIRMRALRDRDAFVASDLGVRHGFERLGLDASPRAILARAEAWRPWRAYATMLLWREAPASRLS